MSVIQDGNKTPPNPRSPVTKDVKNTKDSLDAEQHLLDLEQKEKAEAEEREAREREEAKIFKPLLGRCIRMAMECPYNARMTPLARSQGIVWLKLHPNEVAIATPILAEEFGE